MTQMSLEIGEVIQNNSGTLLLQDCLALLHMYCFYFHSYGASQIIKFIIKFMFPSKNSHSQHWHFFWLFQRQLKKKKNPSSFLLYV